MVRVKNIEIQAVPNQAFSVVIDKVLFDIALKTTSVTIADISIDGSIKLIGVKCMPNRPIIPYEYLESGNFFFVCEGEEYPYYTNFGITQSLVYLTVEEMEAYRG